MNFVRELEKNQFNPWQKKKIFFVSQKATKSLANSFEILMNAEDFKEEWYNKSESYETNVCDIHFNEYFEFLQYFLNLLGHLFY